ncbi:hypothetical protein BDQ12DRAFT_689856 [Crucibulum laeve]|uniref:Uncharacterized protein n=1 Tax=Crucibulum laeve TaxID=68775 RepID=A0A5C3LMC6_9AGAR|nr:hypothetical protein BDQ12DRAFT_689856 [Crucibulum laeve]
MGPGTVCDRCRKKMKRVERRGTLESQQLQQQQLAAAHTQGSLSIPMQQQQQLAAQQQQQHQQRPSHSTPAHPHGIHRTDTILTHSGDRDRASQGSQMSYARGEELGGAGNGGGGGGGVGVATQPTSSLRTIVHGSGKPTSSRVHSPPPAIAHLREMRDEEDQLPTSNVRGGGGGGRAASRNGRPTSTNGNGSGNGAPAPTTSSSPQKRSPLSNGRPSTSPGQMEVDETDADADADADADDIDETLMKAVGGDDERGMEVDGEGEVVLKEELLDAEGEGDGEGDGDGDAEDALAELEDAVDAAEANSSSSGRHKSED